MGQEQSQDEVPVSTEELTTLLTNRFAQKCYTQLEIYCFHHLFRDLADSSSGLHHFSEATLTRFLELPDALAGAGSVLFQLATWLGAFPFPSQAPAILTKDALLRVVTVAARRYADVLPGLSGPRGRRRWWAEVYRSLAVYDRGFGEDTKAAGMQEKGANTIEEEKKAADYRGFAVDAPGDDGDQEDEDDDGLVLAALDSMSALDAFRQGERADIRHSFIPTDNLVKLLELLLLIAPLSSQDSLAAHAAEQLSNDEKLAELRRTARRLLASFGDTGPGVGYKAFMAVVETSLPGLFDPIGPLFEHFLFAREIDLSKRKPPSAGTLASPTTLTASSMLSPSSQPPTPSATTNAPPPLSLRSLLPHNTPLLTVPLLAQLSFFLPPAPLFGNLVPLYAGSTHGFSMGSFEKHVFHWQAPTVVLVRGTLLPAATSTDLTPRERAFLDSLPPRKLPTSRSRRKVLHGSHGTASQPASPLNVRSPTSAITSPAGADVNEGTPNQDDNDDDDDDENEVLYGAYIPAPWKPTPKHPFSTRDTLLFQLAPHHAVHAASSLSPDYAYFNKAPTHPRGLGFGSPIAAASSAATHSSAGGGRGHGSRHHGSRDSLDAGDILRLGPVSLHIDDGLEFGAFTHLAEGGGSFRPNPLPPSSSSLSFGEGRERKGGGQPSADFRDPFLVSEILVLGVGGAAEADHQAREWAWQEREAERRRRVNLGTGDMETDRELLRMAGLVGQNQSGGSMG